MASLARMTRLVALALVGCATTLSPAAAQVRDGDRATAAGSCQFLGIVQGSSVQTGAANRQTGLLNARNEAREKAAELGADFVAWIGENVSFASIDVQAEAYRCM